VYVTYPPELRRKSLLLPRGWTGYFVGHKSESVYLVWDPEKSTVKRVDQATVTVGSGMDDPHNEPSRSARLTEEVPRSQSPLFEPLTHNNEDSDSEDVAEGDGANEDDDNDSVVMDQQSRFFAHMTKGLSLSDEEWIATDLLQQVRAAEAIPLLKAVYGKDISSAALSLRKKVCRDPSKTQKITGFNDQALRDAVEEKLAEAQEELGLTLRQKGAGKGKKGTLTLDHIIFFHLLHHQPVNEKSKIAAFQEIFPDFDLPGNHGPEPDQETVQEVARRDRGDPPWFREQHSPYGHPGQNRRHR